MSDLPTGLTLSDPEASARASGYSWNDIDTYLGSVSQQADEAGFHPDDLSSYLGYSPERVEDAAANLYNTTALTSPLDIKSIDPRGTYADLLRTNSVRGASDLADALGAHAMASSGANGSQLDFVTEQAQRMGMALPSRRSFIDGALALGGGDGADYDIVRDNLISHWQETGQTPDQAVAAAERDPSLADQLVTPPRGLLGELYHAAARGAGDIVYSLKLLGDTAWKATGLLPADYQAAKEEDLKRAMKTYYADNAPTRHDLLGWSANVVGEAGLQGAGLALGGVEGAVAYGALHGADAAWRDTRNLGAAAVGATIGAIEMGVPVKLLHSFEGQAVVRRAVAGAVTLGAGGGLAKILDPLTDAVAGRGYNPPSWNEIGEGVAEGALLGAFGGSLIKAREPRIRQVGLDGTDEVVPFNEPAQMDLGLHEAAAEEVARPSGEFQLGKMEMRPTAAGGEFEYWPIMSGGQQAAEVQISRVGDTAHIDRMGAPGEETLVGGKLSNELGPRAMRGIARQFFEANPDINTITGFRMGGARGIKNAAEVSVTREQIMGKPGEAKVTPGEPEPHNELEAGYRAAGALQKFIDTLPKPLASLLGDEAGRLNLPVSGRKGSALDSYDQIMFKARELAQLKSDATLHLERDLEPLYKVIEPHVREAKRLLDAGDIEGHLNNPLIKVIRSFDEPALIPAANDPLAGVYAVLKNSGGIARGWMEAATAKGENVVRHYLDNWMPRIWKDEENPSYLGGNAWRHERSFETYADAIRAGKRPAISNPLDLMLRSAASEIGFSAHRMLVNDLTDMGKIRWSPSHPGGQNYRIEGMQRLRPTTETAEKIAARQAELDARAAQLTLPGMGHPPLGPIEEAAGGILEHAYTDKDTHTMLTNIQSVLQSTPLDGPVGQAFRRLGNVLQQVKLGLSLFHFGTEVKHGYVTMLSELEKNAAYGNMKALTDAAKLPFAWATLPKKGSEAMGRLAELGGKSFDDIKAVLAANPDLEMLVGGGAGVGWQDVYRPSQYTNPYVEMWRGTYGRNFRERYDNSIFKPGVPIAEAVRLATGINAPLFSWYIPRAKLGAMMEQIQGYLARHPDATYEERMVAARQIVDNTDDRMGELNVNNVFWPKFGRHLASTSMISMSWVYGTIRQTLAAVGIRMRSGGGGLTAEFNPTALSNLANLFVVSAGMNALYTYIKTGKMPNDRDYYTPLPVRIFRDVMGGGAQTGGRSRSGGPAYAMLPGEEKEFYDWMKIGMTAWDRFNAPHGGIAEGLGGGLEGLSSYAGGKLRNYIDLIRAMSTGRDAIGRPVYQRLGAFFLENVMPITISNWEEMRPRSHINRWEAILGIREAPTWFEDPMRFRYQQEYQVRRNYRDAIRRNYQAFLDQQ